MYRENNESSKVYFVLNDKIKEIITLFGYASKIVVAAPSYKVIALPEGEFAEDLILSNGQEESRIKWWKTK